MSTLGLAASACVIQFISGAPVSAADDRIEATLKMEPTKLNFEGSRAANMIYMPSTVKLEDQRPAVVTKEPAYRGKPRYGTLTLGSGDRTTYALAIDTIEGGEPAVYMDLNGNGDLTDDADAGKPWQGKTEAEGRAPEYRGTYVFDVAWAAADGAKSADKYGLNFYWSSDREAIGYYRAAARTGEVTVNGQKLELMLVENDSDARYDKLYDPSKPTPVEKLPKPVFLNIGGDRYDIRATFQFGDFNYIARVSDDGSRLTMEPTARSIRLPRPVERPVALGAGVMAPDFEAVLWTPDAPSEAAPKTFKLSDFRGKKIVVIDMWATWCGPCMAAIPHVSHVAEQVKGQDVEVIALNVSDEAKAFERFAREKGPNYAFTLARDPAGRDRDAGISGNLYKVSGIPHMFVIDKEGRITASISGYSQGDKQLEHALVRMGVKIDGITPEEASKSAPGAGGKTVPMKGLK